MEEVSPFPPTTNVPSRRLRLCLPCHAASSRLLLLDYCVEQRGLVEKRAKQGLVLQQRHELMAKVFRAWAELEH